MRFVHSASELGSVWSTVLMFVSKRLFFEVLELCCKAMCCCCQLAIASTKLVGVRGYIADRRSASFIYLKQSLGLLQARTT